MSNCRLQAPGGIVIATFVSAFLLAPLSVSLCSTLRQNSTATTQAVKLFEIIKLEMEQS